MGATSINNAMKRDRFFKLWSHIKVVVDDNVPEHTKQEDKLWKVCALLVRIRQTSISRPRLSHCCVDEQIRVGRLASWRPNNSILASFFLAWPRKKSLAFWLLFGLFSLSEL